MFGLREVEYLHDALEKANAAAQGRAGMDAQPENSKLSARSLE
jgi:hypothetical protein